MCNEVHVPQRSVRPTHTRLNIVSMLIREDGTSVKWMYHLCEDIGTIINVDLVLNASDVCLMRQYLVTLNVCI